MVVYGKAEMGFVRKRKWGFMLRRRLGFMGVEDVDKEEKGFTRTRKWGLRMRQKWSLQRFEGGKWAYSSGKMGL